MNKFTLSLLLSITFLGVAQAAEPSNENNNSTVTERERELLKQLFVKPFTIDKDGNKIVDESKKFIVSIPGIEEFLVHYFPDHELPKTKLHGPYLPYWGLKENQEQIYLKGPAVNEPLLLNIKHDENRILIGSKIDKIKNKLASMGDAYSEIKEEADTPSIKYWGYISGPYQGEGNLQITPNPHFSDNN